MQKRFIDHHATIRRQQFTAAAVLVVSFVLSRVIFWSMGVRYDSSTLGWYWQYLDVDVLRHHLLSGIFFMHSQPPVFNLFLGLVLKLIPDSPGLCFNVVYVIAGFILYCALYLFLRFSAFSRTSACIFSFLFIISPGSILYENWLFYTYPIAVLLVLASIALHRYQCKQEIFHAGAFLFIVALVCLTRSAYHLVFLLACVALAVVPRGIQRRKVACLAFAAVCLVGSLYLKNAIIFGFFGSSSWMGMNLFNIAQHSVGKNTINELVRLGRIPKVAALPPFSPVDKYSEIDSPHRATPHRPALTIKNKASGHPNFNHEGYVRIAKEYHRAATYLIREYPRLYLSSVFDAWCAYCLPSWHNEYLKPNKPAISVWISRISLFRERGFVDLQPLKRFVFGSDRAAYFYPVSSLLLLSSILLFACMASGVRLYRLKRTGDTSGLAFVFMTFTAVYVAVIGNALDFGENNRFRVETDPLLFLLGIIVARDAYAYLSQRLSRAKAGKSVDARISPGEDAR